MFIIIGFIFVCVGSQFISSMFSIINLLGLGFLFSYIVIYFADIDYSNFTGRIILFLSIILSTIFYKFFYKISERYAAPFLLAIIILVSTELLLYILNLSDEPYYLKSILELFSFFGGFLIGLKFE
jgi:hypothetical protein